MRLLDIGLWCLKGLVAAVVTLMLLFFALLTLAFIPPEAPSFIPEPLLIGVFSFSLAGGLLAGSDPLKWPRFNRSSSRVLLAAGIGSALFGAATRLSYNTTLAMIEFDTRISLHPYWHLWTNKAVAWPLIYSGFLVGAIVGAAVRLSRDPIRFRVVIRCVAGLIFCVWFITATWICWGVYQEGVGLVRRV